MGTDLEVRPDTLEERTGTTNTDLRIGQYGFFAPEEENQYIRAAENEQGRLEGLQSQPFTDAFPGGITTVNGAEKVQSMPILEKSPEYTQGLFNETGAVSAETIMIVLAAIGACAATFFLTRAVSMYQRRKEQ